ncbi:MAG: demethoxyubiquinone hydroxylase family protein [Proteobacteria bacterium]|nr:demethoxyubiquinone hydroxylase family protein [Pseudomonadota bacterium]
MLTSETILKVDHAGEYGAIRIYRAQILVARLLGYRCLGYLREMLAHEKTHFAGFDQLARQRASRTCKGLCLWAVGGYALGTFTALFGPTGIWARTFAVERTVNRHLAEQLVWARSWDEPLRQIVSSIIEDEESHRDEAESAFPDRSIARCVLVPTVSASTEFAIWLSHRL